VTRVSRVMAEEQVRSAFALPTRSNDATIAITSVRINPPLSGLQPKVTYGRWVGRIGL
jgi:hypothetical protein